MTSKRPHRCQHCGWRGWGQESVPKLDAQARRAEQAVVSEQSDVDLSKL